MIFQIIDNKKGDSFLKFNILKISFIILGFISLGLGILGIILPILPTTPFLLLASYFFAKGSNRFHKWFTSTKLYENYLEEFITSRAMTLKRKLSILLPVSAMLISTSIFVNNLYARIGISIIIVMKYYYFYFHIGTLKPNEIKTD